MDGLLLVDKPEGLTSHDVVERCRGLLGQKEVGHGGTLDPMATGLLVMMVGRATKLSDFILSGDKAYRATLLLGTVTDTDDLTGQVLEKKENFQVSLAQLEEGIAKLSGEIQLPVPKYSALKVKGQKLYEKARKGESFTPPLRQMSFRETRLLSFEEGRVMVEFCCTKGSYVRAWAKALGEELGCGATLAELRRYHSAPYGLDQAMALAPLEEGGVEAVKQSPAWIPMTQTLPRWPLVKVQGQEEKLLLNGQISRQLERFLELEYGEMEGLEGIKVVSKRSGRLISLLSHQPPLKFKIRRVFPNSPS